MSVVLRNPDNSRDIVSSQSREMCRDLDLEKTIARAIERFFQERGLQGAIKMADSFSNKKRVRLINVNLNGMAYDFFEEILSDAPERIPGLLDLVHELTITLPDGYEIQVRL